MTGLASRAASALGRRIVRGWRRTRERHGLVLAYHRIARTTGPDPWRLCVDPDRFAAQLAVLTQVADIVPLAELRSQLRRRGERPVVALTFDDGYADLLDAAVPILRRTGAPATVFVTSGNIERAAPYWWDVLAATLLGPGRLPDRVSLPFGPEGFEWRAGSDSDRDVLAPARSRLHLELYARVRALGTADRPAALDAIARALGERAPATPAGRPLTVAELRTAAASGVMEVGAHTVEHRELTGLAPDALDAEIVGSRAALQRLLDRAPDSFAYPFGAFDPAAEARVAAAGFARACTTEPELVHPGTPAFALPRFTVFDHDATAFRRRLAWDWLP